MSSAQRPDGLTALAIINFLVGLSDLLGAVAILLGARAMPFFSRMNSEATEEGRAALEALDNLGLPLYVAVIATGAAAGVLAILSGIGYLKLEAFRGRVLGNLYAVTSVISSVLLGSIMPVELGGGVTLGIIIGLMYPVLTLILLNTTFKEDFVP